MATIMLGHCNLGQKVDITTENKEKQDGQEEKVIQEKLENTISEEQSETTIIQWEFEKNFMKDKGSGIKHPATKVFLRVVGNDENRLLLGTYLGQPYVVEIFNDYPNDTITACSFWYAGAGDDIAVVREDKETLVVYLRQKDEGSTGEDGVISDFMELIKIKILKNAEIKLEESVEN